jgi:hypothetical protein
VCHALLHFPNCRSGSMRELPNTTRSQAARRHSTLSMVPGSLGWCDLGTHPH